MAQAKRNTTRRNPVTVGSLLPKATGVVVAIAALWAMFAVAGTADRANAAASSNGNVENVRAALTGDLRAAQERCAVEGIGC